MPVPPILVVAPPPIATPRGPIAPKFDGAERRAPASRRRSRASPRRCGCAFFDAGSVTPSSRVDGVHLDADQHGVLGRALADRVASLLAE